MDVNILKSSDKSKKENSKTKKNKVLKTEISNVSYDLLNKKKLFPQIFKPPEKQEKQSLEARKENSLKLL